MDVKIDECLLNIMVKEVEGEYICTITAHGKAIDTNLGTDETAAQGKAATLVNGLWEGVEAILNGMVEAYGGAEDISSKE